MWSALLFSLTAPKTWRRSQVDRAETSILPPSSLPAQGPGSPDPGRRTPPVGRRFRPKPWARGPRAGVAAKLRDVPEEDFNGETFAPQAPQAPSPGRPPSRHARAAAAGLRPPRRSTRTPFPAGVHAEGHLRAARPPTAV